MNNKFPSEFNQDSSASIGLSFVKVYNLWHKQIKDQLKEVGLTHPQFIVLSSIGFLSMQNDEVNQVDVSKTSDIDVMTVSTIVRNLEKSSLVMRESSKIDTRAKSIVLTKIGQKKLAEALPIVEKVDHDFFDSLGKHREDFNHLLLQLIEAKAEN